MPGIGGGGCRRADDGLGQDPGCMFSVSWAGHLSLTAAWRPQEPRVSKDSYCYPPRDENPEWPAEGAGDLGFPEPNPGQHQPLLGPSGMFL